ncbi:MULTISPECIES: substrate-binding domain-containing protein [Pseudonocardia]|uniref:D-ribose transporter subunit RbsB n=2 Tax=Pseudonocardia TaxID=1847 RepID=A0A1Y2MUC0_PSEAH|nr:MULTISPECIES: substrate-binding domain-containing protein [Pseudonocardia]OSY38387.1 D-ribose transporter subunit RbsB [Pseudonocardia autotrophica]TDN72569.1 monosaccharide ABC transporter substrate-binding protein (CUT2 family) [Pseudonocardia autotrophica]BBG03277.1 sugar ABC transporter substrate-binding protein [Pseudonocardia autotrophica]GEC24535.1 sugar ABC transporter substrate-binding protein [Pseudonocardia saturnea]
MRSIRKTFAVTVAAASVLALAACSSQGGAQAQNQATGQSYVIAMITHESPGDSFWDKVRAGAEQAATELNVDLRYSNNPDGGQQATLVQNAIDSQVDGVAVTLSQSAQVGPAVQRAVEAGIPAVAFNSGIEDYPDYGIGMYFGSDETLAGRSAGERITEGGGGKTLCVIHEQGSVSLEARCAGVLATSPGTENLQVNGADLPAVQQTIGAKLQQDPSITHVVTLGAPVALAATQAKAESGSQAEVITFDLNADVAAAVQDGRIAFSVDQQPYVQGYMSVQSLWLNLSNGNDLGGGKPVLTGPSFVDSSNIAEIAEYTANNTR